MGLIITGIILFILYKQRKITWHQDKDKYGKVNMAIYKYTIDSYINI